MHLKTLHCLHARPIPWILMNQINLFHSRMQAVIILRSGASAAVGGLRVGAVRAHHAAARVLGGLQERAQPAAQGRGGADRGAGQPHHGGCWVRNAPFADDDALRLHAIASACISE